MEAHYSRAPALPQPLLHWERELWRRLAMTGKEKVAGECTYMRKKNGEKGKQGAYWVKENKTCHLDEERRRERRA